MFFKKYSLVFVTMLLSSEVFAAITIGSPTAGSVKNQAALTMEVSGTCVAGQILKINAVDSANKATALVWTQCQPWGFYVDVNISALKDGAITVKVLQDATSGAQSASVSIVKNTGAVTPPTTPPTTPPVTSGNIPMGVNGHDGMGGLPVYALASSEARFKVLNANNIRSYRAGGDFWNDFASFDKFVALAKKYNVTLRPNIPHQMSQAQAYAMAKRYANDIKIWEIGNEVDGDVGNEAANYKAMLAVYKGIKQASDETGAGIKTMVNVMACNDDSPGRCYGKKDGSMYFLDGAKAAGINFDYISFHFYPHYDNFIDQNGYWINKYLGQMRGMATKYNTKIFYNEMNCGEIYDGSIDGQAGDKGCYDSINLMLQKLNTSYKDIVAEIHMYELIENPDHPVSYERHFGLMYNPTNPKNIFKLVASYAAGSGTTPTTPPPTTTPTPAPSPSPSPAPGKVRILPIGDSLTFGYGSPGGYRNLLSTLLNTTGVPYDYVGSMNDGPASLVDKDHEGHTGWRTDQISAIVNATMDSKKPDVVLLLAGANDILQDTSLSSAPARVLAIADQMRAKNPSVLILIANMFSVPGKEAEIAAFNKSLNRLVNARTTAGQKVYLVDMTPGNIVAGSPDGVHPNAAGYNEMANRWFNKLVQVYGN
jgi:lysophospholipase L1-like esterase